MAVAPKPEVGELYAVYFGTAFHLGIYIGEREVVHYLNNTFVYRDRWEKLLASRTPEHWTYPELEYASAEKVVKKALGEVGKTYPYNLRRFNCERFAIYCKSGGRTRYSKYGQIQGGFATLTRNPMFGAVAELNTRVVEWLAFNLGGPSGKQPSLMIRRIGSSVTGWLFCASEGSAN